VSLRKFKEWSLKVSELTRAEVDQHREECLIRLKKVGLNQQVRLTKAARRLQGREMESGILMYQAILDCLAPPDDPPRIVSWDELEREASKGELGRE